MPFIGSMVAGSVLAVVLATPAAALDLDVGGIAGASVGGNGRGGLDIGLEVSLGGKAGIQADSKTSVGGGSLFGGGGVLSGGSLVDSNTSASIGSNNGVKASNSTTVGGKNSVLDSSTRASVGSINAGVDASVSTRAIPDANVDLSHGGARPTTPRNAGNPSKPNEPGKKPNPANPGNHNTPENKPNAGYLRLAGKPDCPDGVSGRCSGSAGDSPDLQALVARLPDAEFVRNMRKCRGILADPNKYERPLIELCTLLQAAAR
ncbi:hypothetical protein [Chelativorans sp. AA-79]|uniref:hypothetical protein n=1 Tax=Chelativorans sp. AA-79 TaxID=3028735 RepID=UPI0023F641ED|nr:hypothetical protein [Chelativorans sp. AA-79]WEX09053.1 hypothetical protein PVE73_23905 [Chelativorans sp. AA-79]